MILGAHGVEVELTVERKVYQSTPTLRILGRGFNATGSRGGNTLRWGSSLRGLGANYTITDAQTTQLPGLLASLSAALGGFQAAMEQIGEESNVTSFTHTEFGRTLSSNGQGSDHGWGGHALAFGGAVRGQDIYGAMPNLQINGPDDIGEGRILPRVGVDQYAATLAKWFGLTPAELDQVFPNLPQFGASDLGFMG